jgi:hypothetical protein
VLSRARQRIWLITGADKSERLGDLVEGTAAITANRVERRGTLVIADREAAGATLPHPQ